jgi:transposase-like protein
MDTQVAVGAEDVQVVAKPRRRTYTAEYKRRILKEADACTTAGAIGALLRRGGLYSSHLVAWRRARACGELAGLAPKRRGRKPRPVDPRDRIGKKRRPIMSAQCTAGLPRAPIRPARPYRAPAPDARRRAK